MNINPLANKKPARRFVVVALIVATAVTLAYVASRIILNTQVSKPVPVETRLDDVQSPTLP